MTEQKHTPGPWVRNSTAPKIIMSGSFINGHEGYIVGSVSGNDNSGFYASEQEAEANAKLIAASPDLLAAAQKTVDAWAKFIASFDYVPGIGDQAEDMEFREIMELRAAIAKATE